MTVERVARRRPAASTVSVAPAPAASDGLDVDELRPVGADVGLVVGVERLHRGLSLTDGRLGLGVLRTRALAEEGGQGDRGKDADDQNDDQELDEGEALLVLSALSGAC